jgi:predicted ATPase
MIERLQLSNFKSIKEGVFDLENLTIFSGLNGMGKSSALQSMLLLRQSFEKHLLPDNGLSLTGEYVQIGTGKDLLFTDSQDEFVYIEMHWEHSSVRFRFDYRENSDLQPIARLEGDLTGDPWEEALFTPGFQYLSAERISPKSIYDVSDYAVNQRRFLGINGEFTAHFLAENSPKKIHINALRHEKSLTDNLGDNLNAWMSDISPGIKVVAKMIPEVNKVSLHYQFSSRTESTAPFRPENIGYGLTYVLPIVTAVLSARSGDLLFIENPESHLHPGGQSLVARLIALACQAGVQIVVETHSDHFLNGIRTSVKANGIDPDKVSIYFLSRDIESTEHAIEIEQVSIGADGKVSHWPSGFFDEWDKSLDALIR